MKSTLVSVMFPAWVWLQNPQEQFLYASYSSRLSFRDSLKCRRIIESQWYQLRWSAIFKIRSDQNAKVKFENDKTGYRIAASVNSNVTGDGGSIIVLDDPNSADSSDTDLENASYWFSSTWSTRLNDKANDCRIIVQQRLSEVDITGFVLANDEGNNWVHLVIPMEYEPHRRCKTVPLPSTNGKPWCDPREYDGELMWPERIGETELRILKNDLGNDYAISGQLAQLPSPTGGGIIKKHWFKPWKFSSPPQLIHTIQSWDTAFEVNDKNAYSACLTFGLFKEATGAVSLILLSMYRAKLEYPDLRKMAQRLYLDYNDKEIDKPIKPSGFNRPDMVLIEAKASGISLVQDLIRGGIPAMRFDPSRHGDKMQRVRIISHLIECGRVYVPAKPPDFLKLRQFADIFVSQLCLFPNGESRDVTDCLTQVMLRLSMSGWLTNQQDLDRGDLSVKTPAEAYY